MGLLKERIRTGCPRCKHLKGTLLQDCDKCDPIICRDGIIRCKNFELLTEENRFQRDNPGKRKRGEWDL